MHTPSVRVTRQVRLRIDEYRSNKHVVLVESIAGDSRVIDRQLYGLRRAGMSDSFGSDYGSVVRRLYVGSERFVKGSTIQN